MRFFLMTVVALAVLTGSGCEKTATDHQADAVRNAAKSNAESVRASTQSTADKLRENSGKDALGEVLVKLEIGGKEVTGRGTSTDIIEASVRAYLFALNKVSANPSQATSQSSSV